jgi:ABC-type multidrug transport system fused ATPase/permease subunit
MLGLMFWLNWNFGLLAMSVTPVLLILVSRFKKAVKAATKQVRTNESEIVSVVEQGLESERVVKAFRRQDLEEWTLEKVSREMMDSALKARRINALLSPLERVAAVLWRGAFMILSGALTAGVLTIPSLVHLPTLRDLRN